MNHRVLKFKLKPIFVPRLKTISRHTDRLPQPTDGTTRSQWSMKNSLECCPMVATGRIAAVAQIDPLYSPGGVNLYLH